MSSAARSESKTVEMSSAELLGAALAFERSDKNETTPSNGVPRPAGTLRLAPPRPSAPPPSASTQPSAPLSRPAGPPPLPTSSVVSAGRNIASGSIIPPPPSARVRPLPAPPPSRPAPASLRVPVAPPSTRAIPPPPPSHNSSLPPASSVRRVPPPLPKREATIPMQFGPATLPAPPPPLSGPPPSASVPPTMPPTASERPRSDRPRSSRDGLRIPSPPPIPARDVTTAAMRARHSTDHGVGSGERRPVWSDSRKNPPSLSTTQVGLGAVKLDEAGRPILPSNTVRYFVKQGERPGQLVLDAVMPGQTVADDALVVTLAPEREADVQRLTRVIAGLRA